MFHNVPFRDPPLANLTVAAALFTLSDEMIAKDFCCSCLRSLLAQRGDGPSLEFMVPSEGAAAFVSPPASPGPLVTQTV